MNFLSLFSEVKDLTADKVCTRYVNYGYTHCEDLPDINTIDQCGLTTIDKSYNSSGNKPVDYEPACRALCLANPECEFYMVYLDWQQAYCTLKTYESVMNSAKIDLDDASTMDTTYCNFNTAAAGYKFLSTCDHTKGCAWEVDENTFIMGTKTCTNWDSLDKCTFPEEETTTVAPEPTEEETTRSRRTLPVLPTIPTVLPTMPTRPTKPTALPATTVPADPTVAPEEVTTVAPEPTEAEETTRSRRTLPVLPTIPTVIPTMPTRPTKPTALPATTVPAVPTGAPEEPTTTVAPEETTTAAPEPYVPTTTDSSVIPPRPDGQGTSPPDEDSSSAEDSNIAAVAVGSAAAGAAGIAGAAAAYMKGGFGSSASSGMTGAEDVNLEDMHMEREQVADVDLDMFA